MNHNIDIYNIPFSTNDTLNIMQCGKLTTYNTVSSIPHLYTDYVLTFVVNGSGTYIINNTPHNVEIGNVFFTTPNTITSWKTRKDDPLEYIFLIFNGSNHSKFLTSCGLGLESRVFWYAQKNTDTLKKIIDMLFLIIEEGQKETPSCYKLTAYFYLIIDLIFQNPKNQSSVETNKTNLYLKNALSFINNNFSTNITIQDIANHVNIDRTYLYKIFISEFEMSPLQYLNDLRIEKSKEILNNGSHSIAFVAQMVGFYDHSHFSRLFKKKYSITPTEYIKSQNKNN